MKLEVRQVREEEALEIATWRYEPPYSFYDADADPDDLAVPDLRPRDERQRLPLPRDDAHSMKWVAELTTIGGGDRLASR